MFYYDYYDIKDTQTLPVCGYVICRNRYLYRVEVQMVEKDGETLKRDFKLVVYNTREEAEAFIKDQRHLQVRDIEIDPNFETG